MKSRKRLLISFFEILASVLADASVLCNTSTSRDLITIRSRAEHEGPSFYTITLPQFSKCFERSLENGSWLPELFTGFSRSRSSCLPRFLSGFTSLVFNHTGELRDDSSIEAVEAIRQICLVLNKIKMDCTKERQRSAELAFSACEAEISKFRINIGSYWSTFVTVALISLVLLLLESRSLCPRVEFVEVNTVLGQPSMVPRVTGSTFIDSGPGDFRDLSLLTPTGSLIQTNYWMISEKNTALEQILSLVEMKIQSVYALFQRLLNLLESLPSNLCTINTYSRDLCESLLLTSSLLSGEPVGK